MKISTGSETNEYDGVISTLKANQLNEILLGDDTQQLSQSLSSIPHLTMNTTNIVYDKDVIDDKYASFGALVPKN